MKELRPRSTKGGAHIRVLFAFDIQSRAILLVAGDKAGNWTKWYAPNIPIADRLFTEHQEKLKKEAEAAIAAKPNKKGQETMTTLDDLRRRRPGDRARNDTIKDEMDREVAQYRLRELREDASCTQTSLAAAIGVGQNRVSQMEHGNLGTSRADTLRKYVEATGGELEVAVKRPDGSRVVLSL